MSEQIRFFKKNKIDLSNSSSSIAVTDTVALNNGSDFVDFLRNRKNSSAWVTTGSTDAALTQLDVTIGGLQTIDSILLVLHNFKAFTIQYWSGIAWLDFSTPIAETVNTDDNSFFQFDAVSTDKIRIIIQGTTVVDADKIMRQLIITEELGQLNSWPLIKNPKTSSSKVVNKMLSGKINLVESIESFSTTLDVKVLSNETDLDLIEEIHTRRQGVLLWLGGGDEAQFRAGVRIGFRNEDIYLVRAVDDYNPERYKGIYTSGIKFKMKLQESVQ